MAREFILPLVLGFLNLFICRLGLLLGIMAGLKFVPYIFVYPVFYGILSAVLTYVQPKQWLTNALLLCTLPIIYWYGLLFGDDRLDFHNYNVFSDAGMWITMLITLALSVLISYIMSGKRINRSAGN